MFSVLMAPCVGEGQHEPLPVAAVKELPAK